MASQLRSQLQTLSKKAGIKASASAKAPPSLLFDASTAAATDNHTIFELGQNGFAELRLLDERFAQSEALFGHTDSKVFDRGAQTAATLAQLDKSIATFLQTLSPYVLLKPAQKALEYMFRRYQIADKHQEALIACVLPFHQTVIFSRILQLLKLPPQWEFLKSASQNDTLVPRSVISQHCISDVSVLEFICKLAENSATKGRTAQHKLAVTLFTVVVLEVLGTSKKVPEKLVLFLLPYISRGLAHADKYPDYFKASCMLAAFLGTHVKLTDAVLEALLLQILKGVERENSECLLPVVCLVQSQASLPKKVFDQLRQLPDITPSLTGLCQTYDLQNFLYLFLSRAIEEIQSNVEGPVEEMFIQLTHLNPKPQTIRILQSLFEAFILRPTLLDSFSRLLRCIDKHQPVAVDEVLRQGLGVAGRRDVILKLVKHALPSTRHQVLDDFGVTLLLGLEHPKSEVRLSAVNALGLITDDISLRNRLVEKINDPDPAIREHVLKNTNLVSQVDTSLLLQSLLEVVEDPASSSNLVRLALDQLGAVVQEDLHDEFAPRILACFLHFVSTNAPKKVREAVLSLVDAKSNLLRDLFAGLRKSALLHTAETKTQDDVIVLSQTLVTHLAKKLKKQDVLEFFISSLSESKSLPARAMGICVIIEAAAQSPSSDLTSRALAFITQVWNMVPPQDRIISASQLITPDGIPVPTRFPSLVSLLGFGLLWVLRSCSFAEGSNDLSVLRSLFIFIVSLGHDFGKFMMAQFCINLKDTNLKMLLPFWLAKRVSPSECLTSFGVVPLSSVVASFHVLHAMLNNLDHATLIPCIVVGLGNGSKAIRHAVLMLVMGLKDTKIQAFLSLVVRLRDEFLAADSFLVNNFAVQVQQIDVKTHQIVQDMLLEFLAIGDAYASTLILRFFQHVPSKVLSGKTFPILSSLLSRSSLSTREESELVQLLIKRLTHETVSSSNFFVLLKSVLESQLILDGNIGVSCKGLEQIDLTMFKACSSSQQNELFEQLCLLVKRSDTSLAATQALGRIALDSALLLPHLELAVNYLSSPENFKEMSFSKVVNLLEVLQIITPNQLQDLVVPMFSLLAATHKATTHSFEELEYVKQLLLTALLQFFKQTDAKFQENLKLVDLTSLVQCVSPSVVNEPLRSQTRNSALILFSVVASVAPQVARKVVIPMFSFSLSLKDDSHSFAILQQTIETVIPPTIHLMTVANLVPCFVEMACNIASSQALRLFTTLHSTISRCFETLPTSHLHESIAWLLQKMIDRQESKEERETLFADPEFLHLLCQNFSLPEQVATLVSLIDLVVMHPSSKSTSGLSAKLHTEALIQKWQEAVLQFVGSQLGHPSLVDKNEALTDKSAVETQYVRLFEKLFTLLRQFKETKSLRKDAIQVALTKLNHLLSTPMFVSVVKALLQDPEPATQRRALQLLQAKVSKRGQHDDLLLMSILPCLQDLMVEKTDDQILGMVFTCLQSLCALAQGTSSTELSGLLPRLQDWVARRIGDVGAERLKVVVHGIKCLGSVAAQLETQLVPHLYSVLKLTLEWLERTLQNVPPIDAALSKELQLSSLSALHAIVCAVPVFVSPFLKRIISALIHPALTEGTEAAVSARATLSAMAASIEARVLLPVMFPLWEPAIVLGSSSVQRLCWFLSVIETHFTSQVARDESKGIFQFLLQSFNIRRDHQLQDMDQVEDTLVSATINILIKLRETELKALFLSILEWLQILNDPDSTAVDVNMDRYSIFFRLVLQLLITLKSLFVPYCTYFVKLCVQILRIRPEAVRKKKRTADGVERRALQNSVQSLVIQSLHQAFLVDTNRALPRDFFDQLMEPLVEQLPNDAVGPCLEEMVARLGNHVLWKPLNRLVLLKTRSSEVSVRLAAINLLMTFFTRFGENWLVLLPESLSYIAELMEDSEQEVQRAVQLLIRTIEQLSGESLAHYLS